jgi:hypothetical protein
MNLSPVELIAAVLLVTYAAVWFWQQRKRRNRTWHEIVAQLRRNDWGIEDVAEGYLYKGGIRATAQDIWPRIAGCEGLWSMYKNAPVFVELADYAAEHGDGVDQELLKGLRSDAFQIRLYVICALTQYAFSASSSSASENAHHAAAAYCSMLARLTEFIQEHSSRFFPSYLDAVA